MSLPTLLTESQLAEFRRVTKQTLRNERLRGDGPPYLKVGGRVLYSEEDIAAWLATKRRTSTSDPGPGAAAPTPAA
jgi:hypothetical protein